LMSDHGGELLQSPNINNDNERQLVLDLHSSKD
jgi:hypothetical protein